MFDELLNPLPYVDLHAPEVIAPIPKIVASEHVVSTGLPSSTTVDQDAPSPIAHMGNDPYFGILIPEVTSDQSSSSDVIHTIVPPDHQVKLDELGGRHQMGIFLKVPHRLFINQSKYALESLKKYGFESCDPVDTPMVEKSKLDEDKEGKAVDPSHYRGMIGTLLYLIARTVHRGLWYPKDSSIALTAFADADHAGCQDTRRSTSGSIQLLGDRLVSWSSKRQKSAAISSTEAEYIALSGEKVRSGIMPTEMELTLEQTQQGVSYEVSILVILPEHSSDTYVFTVKMEILLEPTSNKLLVGYGSSVIEFELLKTLDVSQNPLANDTSIDFKSIFYIDLVLERFNTTAGNPVKKILLKLNLSDHRILKDGGGEYTGTHSHEAIQADYDHQRNKPYSPRPSLKLCSCKSTSRVAKDLWEKI
ncbi:hypothetical protein Tco_1418587 [Tanacetum coccineum]